MGKYEDAVTALRDQGIDDLADVFDEFSASALRRKAAERDQFEQELTELKGQYASVVAAPKKEQALRDYGVDFDGLSPLEREVILDRIEVRDGEVTKSQVAEIVEKYDLPVSETTEEKADLPAAGRVAQQARSAPAGGQKGAVNVIRPEDAQEWSTEKFLRLKQQHPDEFEALKRGEAIHVAFS